MRLSARLAWRVAGAVSAIATVFTWEWAVWWAAALLRFATTGERITVTRQATKEPSTGAERDNQHGLYDQSKPSDTNAVALPAPPEPR